MNLRPLGYEPTRAPSLTSRCIPHLLPDLRVCVSAVPSGPARCDRFRSVLVAELVAATRVVVRVMTVHKLTAGDGYTYLTRQVASADERRTQGQSLADYYVARGNPPGVWLGKAAQQLGLD